MANSLEDDAFQAALSLVDELVLDVGGSDGIPSLFADADADADAQMQTQTRTRRRVKYNEKRKVLRQAGVYGDPNRARKARTEEVASLRKQVEKLQLDLEVLQTQNEPAKHPPSANILTSCQPNKWQEIVLNQRRRRKEAERDNIHLKLVLEKHQNVANRLHGLLRKRTTQLTNECSSLMNLVCPKSYMVDVLELGGDVGDFNELLRRLGAAYRDIDAVLDANGLNGMTVRPCDVHICEGIEGKFVELFTYKVLPFDVRTTTAAAWKHFKGVEKHLGNGTIYKKAEKDLDEPYTIVADFTKEVYSNNSRADIKVKQIVRRYVEPERDIVIWVAHAKPAEIKHKMLRGLTYSSRGYAVTRQFPDSPPDRELSVLQQCSRISLDHEVGARFPPDDVRALTSFLIANAAQNMRVHRELIENALVERGRVNWLV